MSLTHAVAHGPAAVAAGPALADDDAAVAAVAVHDDAAVAADGAAAAAAVLHVVVVGVHHDVVRPVAQAARAVPLQAVVHLLRLEMGLRLEEV